MPLTSYRVRIPHTLFLPASLGKHSIGHWSTETPSRGACAAGQCTLPSRWIAPQCAGERKANLHLLGHPEWDLRRRAPLFLRQARFQPAPSASDISRRCTDEPLTDDRVHRILREAKQFHARDGLTVNTSDSGFEGVDCLSVKQNVLSEDLVRSFRNNGFAVVHGVLSAAELDVVRDVVARADALTEPLRPYAALQKETRHADPKYKQVLGSHSDLRFFYPEHDEIVRGTTGATIAKELMGVDHVRLWTESVLTKPPQASGSAPTPWHQDFAFLPFDRRDSVNMWIAIQDITVEQGALEFLPRSHRIGPIGRISFTSDRPIAEVLRDDDREYLGDVVVCPLNAGDAVAFGSMTFHRAGANQTDRPRRALSINYMGGNVLYTGMPFYKSDGLDLVVGGPFNHERFPVVA